MKPLVPDTAMDDLKIQAQMKTADAVKSLEPAIEGTMMKTAESVDTLKKIEENTKPKQVQDVRVINEEKAPDVQKISLEGISVITLKGDKGDKGDAGKDATPPTEKELVSLIQPLIPAPIKGDAGIDGKDGIDGKTPTNEQIVALLKPLIPSPLQGKDGKNGKDGKDGTLITAQEIIDKVKGKLSYNDLTDLPNIERYLAGSGKQASRDYDLVELKDVSISSPSNAQVLKYNATTKKWENGTDASGSSPLTTKGDIYGYSTVDARVPVGADGQVLTADSTQVLGVKWAAPSAPAASIDYTTPMMLMGA
jgi:hypothetical protein